MVRFFVAPEELEHSDIILTGENAQLLSKLPQVQTLAAKGYDVLLCSEDVDEFIPQTLVSYSELGFCNASLS